MSQSSRRRSTAAAVALTAGITASAALLLSACGPDDPTASSTTAATPAGSSGPANPGGGSGKGGAPASAKPAGSTAPINGTAHNGLTISDGSRFVVMNGTRVDFGTLVRDLAWSPDGRKAVFVDGDGDIAVSNPDGSGRVVVARNPGGVTWSHPTWEVRTADPQDSLPALNEILFAAGGGATAKLYSVHATAHDGTPAVLRLGSEGGQGTLPQTGNIWPSAAGTAGSSTYANPGTGEVYLRDDNLRQQGSKLAPGSEPALFETGEESDIVFVRSVGGHDHLFVEHSGSMGPTYKDITPNATTDYTEPAWSPEGRTIAARTTEGVVTLPADGSAAPVKVSGYHGLPAYRAS